MGLQTIWVVLRGVNFALHILQVFGFGGLMPFAIFPPHCFDNFKLSAANFVSVFLMTAVAFLANVALVFHQLRHAVSASHFPIPSS
ncbi:hypothetical protein [Serratia ficaria]|uniref:hypothetical protein n=1 Tax=Serratia ficaria TaxID=61651 RepID=UPI0021C9E0BB|nr:hypothetical protein [Serratia ficaria]